MRKKSYMKIRIRYLFIFILFVIYVPILISLYFTYERSLKEIRVGFEKSHSNILSGIKAHIKSEIEKINLLLASLSNHPEVVNKNTNYCDNLFAELKNNCGYCLNIVLADMNGNNIGSAVKPQEARKLNYLDREWFHNGIKGKPYINSPHISKLFKEKTFMITYPVFNKGRQVAVLGIPINLSKISEHITKNYNVSEKTNIAIVNNKGIVMYNLLFPDFVGGPVRTKALQELLFSGDKGSKELVGFDGLNRFYMFDTIDDIKWKVFVSMPPTELYAEGYKRVRNQLYISTIFFIFGVFLSILVGRKFAKNTEIILNTFNDLKEGKREIKTFPQKCCFEFVEIFKSLNETILSIANYERENERLQRFYRLLSEINQKIVRYKDIDLLIQEVAKDIVEIGKFDLTLVAEYQQEGDITFKEMSFCLSKRMEDKINIADLNKGKIRSKLFSDMLRAKHTLVSERCFLTEDEKGIDLHTAYIPIFSGKSLYGVLIIGIKDKKEFSEKEIALFEEMAGDLGFAINTYLVTQEKEKNQLFLNSIFEHIGGGLLVIDKNMKVVLANKNFIETAQKDEKSITEKHCYELIYNIKEPCPSFDRDCLAKLVFEDGIERTTVCDISDKNGGKRTYSVRYSAIKKDNIVEYVILMLTDITDFKMLERQYLHAQKMEVVGRLAAGIAHDFNNILTGIIGSASLANMAVTDKNVQNYLSTIISLSDRAANLVKSLLTFSRKQPTSPEIINVNEVLLKIEKVLKRIMGENISIKLILSTLPSKIYIDPIQFEQIVINLAVNARDAIVGYNGFFKIETELVEITNEFIKTHGYGKEGKYVLISFSDNGCGIPPDIIDKIFDPFFTTKEAGKGTGLGLSVVYGIVKSFDGFINVYSEVGKGTIFKVYFPLYLEEGDNIDKEETFVKFEKLNLSTLIVEDDIAVAEVLRVLLENFGITSEVANDGLSALEIIKRKSFDLVISDIVMPKLNGIELYKKVREFNQKIEFIFISGYPYDFIKGDFLIDINHLLTKPVTPEKLYSKIVEIFNIKINQASR